MKKHIMSARDVSFIPVIFLPGCFGSDSKNPINGPG
jgi:hypothetical protein